MSENLKFEIINDGRTLRVTTENPADFAQYIKDNEEEALTSYTPNSNMAFMNLTEQYSTNGWRVYTADQLGQLSECLVICEEASIDDDGNPELIGRSWTNIEDYEIVSPLDLILSVGYYDFEIWE